MNITQHHHRRVVSVMAMLVAYDIDIEIVAVLENIAVWHTVRNDVIYARANALLKMMKTNG